jgi:uncharacterized integral membrane protein
MEFLMSVLFETEWGAIIVGFILLVGFIIYFLENKPKI